MADVDDEDRRNAAAQLIQIRWREYLARTRTATNAGDESSERALSEEEQREQLLTKCRALIAEREHVIQQNLSQQWQLVRMIADRRAHQNDATQAPGTDLAAVDVDAKYWESIARIRADRLAVEGRRSEADRELQDSKSRNDSVLQEALQCERRLRQHIRDVAASATFLRNSKPIAPRVMDDWIAEDMSMQSQVHEVRVQYIKLRNRNARLAAFLKQKEQLNDGLHLIDFEQLKIENTNLNEKIEERNEDLLKLRKKATTTIHILTHVKEKLEFVKAENVQLHKQVSQQEELLTVLRDRLANTKKDRDVYVNENLRMKEKMPMIGAEDLLLDYELRKKELENLRIEIVTLTNQHHELLQWITSHQSQLEKLHGAAMAAGVTTS